MSRRQPIPLHMLGSKRPGEWISVREFCLEIGATAGQLKPELITTWLPDPTGLEAYAVILFYDDESKWSMAAHYNRERILGGAPSRPAPKPNGVASEDARTPAS